MSLDLTKYRRIFLEEAADHLAEMSHALLGLEKELAGAESIDTLFRMAHSIKSMAASLGYEPIADLAHRMEDRMEGVRRAGRVRDPAELAILFQALEALEAMVAAVADERELPPVEEALIARLAEVQGGDGAPAPADSDEPAAAPAAHPKKVRS